MKRLIEFFERLTLRGILFFLFIFLISFLIVNLFLFNLANITCTKFDVVPYRYESVGLFGTLTKIQTTEENADGHSRLCVETANGEPSFFSISENMNLILKQAQKNSMEVKEDDKLDKEPMG